MSRSAGLILLVLALASSSSLGCRGALPTPNVAAEEPEAKIPGIKRAAEAQDRSALPRLVESLADDDPAVRLFAIGALQKFTGDRFGYEYYFDEEQRKPSLAKWREWLKEQQQQQSTQSP